MNSSLINTIKRYDQTGNGVHLTPQFTNQGPLLVPFYANGGTLPGLVYGVSENLGMENTTGIAQSQPFSYFAVAERFTVAATTASTIMGRGPEQPQ